MENGKLPIKLRKSVEKELSAGESIRWIEQPIARFFNRSTVGICLSLLIPLLFFSVAGFVTYQQSRGMGRTLLEFPGLIGILIFLMGTIVPLILLFLVPYLNWLESRQSVYVITSERAFVLTVGSPTTVTSFIPPEVKVISRRKHKDGSGDLIIYAHKSKDYDGDIQTQEIGFKQVRDPKAFERMLHQLNHY